MRERERERERETDDKVEVERQNRKRKREVTDWTWSATEGDSDVYWHNQSTARYYSLNWLQPKSELKSYAHVLRSHVYSQAATT